MNPLKKEKIRSSSECASDLVLSKSAKDVYERQMTYPAIRYQREDVVEIYADSEPFSILDLYPSLREKVIDEIDLRGLHVQ